MNQIQVNNWRFRYVYVYDPCTNILYYYLTNSTSCNYSSPSSQESPLYQPAEYSDEWNFENTYSGLMSKRECYVPFYCYTNYENTKQTKPRCCTYPLTNVPVESCKIYLLPKTGYCKANEATVQCTCNAIEQEIPEKLVKNPEHSTSSPTMSVQSETGSPNRRVSLDSKKVSLSSAGVLSSHRYSTVSERSDGLDHDIPPAHRGSILSKRSDGLDHDMLPTHRGSILSKRSDGVDNVPYSDRGVCLCCKRKCGMDRGSPLLQSSKKSHQTRGSLITSQSYNVIGKDAEIMAAPDTEEKEMITDTSSTRNRCRPRTETSGPYILVKIQEDCCKCGKVKSMPYPKCLCQHHTSVGTVKEEKQGSDVESRLSNQYYDNAQQVQYQTQDCCCSTNVTSCCRPCCESAETVEEDREIVCQKVAHEQIPPGANEPYCECDDYCGTQDTGRRFEYCKGLYQQGCQNLWNEVPCCQCGEISEKSERSTSITSLKKKKKCFLFRKKKN